MKVRADKLKKGDFVIHDGRVKILTHFSVYQDHTNYFGVRVNSMVYLGFKNSSKSFRRKPDFLFEVLDEETANRVLEQAAKDKSRITVEQEIIHYLTVHGYPKHLAIPVATGIIYGELMPLLTKKSEQ